MQLLTLLVLATATQDPQAQSLLLTYGPMIVSGGCSVLVALGLFSLNSKIEIVVQHKLEELARTTAASQAATEQAHATQQAAMQQAHTNEMEKLLALLEVHRRDMERMMAKLNALAAISLQDDKEGLVRFFLNAPNGKP